MQIQPAALLSAVWIMAVVLGAFGRAQIIVLDVKVLAAGADMRKVLLEIANPRRVAHPFQHCLFLQHPPKEIQRIGHRHVYVVGGFGKFPSTARKRLFDSLRTMLVARISSTRSDSVMK